MKSIRTLFIIAIGMMVLTATANSTAKLEQKQKVELVSEFTSPMIKVVDVFQSINLSQTVVAVNVEQVSFKKVNEPNTTYPISKDVGWQSSILYLTTINQNTTAGDSYKLLYDKTTKELNLYRDIS